MRKRFCCDMRGMLSFLLLFLISKKPMTGQELSVELEKRRGEKPSSGTIYPALKYLRENNLIKEHKDGKEIKYTITENGKRGLKKAKGQFMKIFGGVL